MIKKLCLFGGLELINIIFILLALAKGTSLEKILLVELMQAVLILWILRQKKDKVL